MPDRVNLQFLLKSRPAGFPTTDNWEAREAPVPQLQEGGVLVKTHYISLDPAMRGWMNDLKSYIPPVGIGEVMRAVAVGEVMESRNPGFKEGDFVSGALGVQRFALSDGKGLFTVDASVFPLPKYLGPLGMPGITAYFGLLDVGKPKSGETVLVSSAAGAVGTVVGQIAKIMECRVVGIAGSPEKCAFLTEELGFDDAINYKKEIIPRRLRETCPDGIDVYFDNVGGKLLDQVLAQINLRARIVICGAISQYNTTSGIEGPANYITLLINRARMEGFITFDYSDRYLEAAQQIARWMLEKRLTSKEYIVDGLETFPETLLRLFSGEHFGKLILRVTD